MGGFRKAASMNPALKTVGSEAHHSKEAEITAKTITLVKNEENVLPLTLGEEDRVSFFYPQASAENSFRYAFDKLKAEGIVPESAQADFNVFPGKQAEEFADIIEDTAAVVISVESWGENYFDPTADTTISRRTKFVDELTELAHSSGKKVILLSMVLPYDVARFDDADAIIAAYSHKKMPVIPETFNGELTAYGPSYPAAIMTVFGANRPTGKLPVAVYQVDETYHFTDEVLYPLGYGLTYDTGEPLETTTEPAETTADTTETTETTAETTAAAQETEKKTDAPAAANVRTTAAKAAESQKAPSPDTGDAGVAVPLALLTLAAGAAVACRRKR